MKKQSVILCLGVIVFEAIVFFGVSTYFGWSYVDISALGGISLFGLVYLIKYNSYQVTNIDNAYERAWASTAEERLPFSFKLDPVRTGMLLYAAVSFVIAIIVYFPYFID
ncbi:hypothetical protein ACFOZY_09835 [Chungangia koreensis]|uniref:DUF3899 domain-containing protein n=1 Tax=Chungangia koreensis TaxID=752657 RepID=A0ABV8X5N6_9LACT